MTESSTPLQPGDRVRVLPLDDSWTREARDAFPGHVGIVEALKRDPFYAANQLALVKFDPPVSTSTFNRFRGATQFHFEVTELERIP